MGDSRRFDLFAAVIQRNFPAFRYKAVADIAGGKGFLQLALRQRGYNVTTFDKRSGYKKKSRKFRYQYRYFDSKIKQPFDLLVGMHPDEATDVIIEEAAKRKIPFVICPCCVKPTTTVFFGQHSFSRWVKHLEAYAVKLGFSVTKTKLRMNGKNLVLIGRFKCGGS